MKKSIIALIAVAFVATAVSTLSSCSAAEDALQDGNKVALCDGTEYNSESQFCYDESKIMDKCGGKQYNPDNFNCIKNKLVEKEGAGNTSSSSGDEGLDLSVLCKANGQYAFCGYVGNGTTDLGGCYTIDPTYEENEGKSCDQLLAACRQYGTVFIGVNPSALTEANGWGAGLRCVEHGGTVVSAGGTSSNSGGGTSSNSGGGTSSNSGGGTGKYCMWDSDPDNCWPITLDSEDEATQTEAGCRAQSGIVVTSCNQMLEYCDWGPRVGEDYGCWPLDPADIVTREDCAMNAIYGNTSGTGVVSVCPRGIGK